MIRMEHPDLPGQPIRVRPGQVASRHRSGWREAPEPEPQPEPDQEQRPRRRRAAVTTEEEQQHGTDAA